jgi:hypothetical protein
MRSEKINFKVVAAVFCAFVGIMLGRIAYPHGSYVLLVGWPGTSQANMMRMAADAGGTFVQAGGPAWLAVVHSDAPDFAARLMQQGALIVLDHALAAGCTEEDENERTR